MTLTEPRGAQQVRFAERVPLQNAIQGVVRLSPSQGLPGADVGGFIAVAAAMLGPGVVPASDQMSGDSPWS